MPHTLSPVKSVTEAFLNQEHRALITEYMGARDCGQLPLGVPQTTSVWLSSTMTLHLKKGRIQPSSPTTVLISWGSGSHQEEAKNHAAIRALEYLKING